MNNDVGRPNRSADALSAAVNDPAEIRFSLLWIGAVLAVFLAARVLALAPGSDRQVTIAVLGLPLPELCLFRRVAGFDCPGCGLTRSFVFVSRLQLGQAWAMHPVGTLLAGYLAATIPLRLWRVHRLRGSQSVHRTWPWEAALVVALVVAMYVRWIWQLLA